MRSWQVGHILRLIANNPKQVLLCLYSGIMRRIFHDHLIKISIDGFDLEIITSVLC